MRNPNDIYNEGYCFYTGTQGFPMNYRLAFQRFTEAASMLHGPSMNYLGLMYEHGNGVPVDLQQAISWYQKAADQGDSFGMYNLGRKYYDGHGVPQDVTHAMNLLREAYSLGNPHAGFYVGDQLLDCGKIREAYRAYQSAASAGNYAKAWHQIGYMIETYPELTGLVNDKDRIRKALPCYQKAAEQGLPVGMYMYGQRLFHLEYYREGVQWVKKAADAGLPEAKKRYRLLRITGK